VVSRHINNLFKSEEVDKNEVCAFFAQTTKSGGHKDKTQTRQVEYYNLDVILSVGYRTNSTIIELIKAFSATWFGLDSYDREEFKNWRSQFVSSNSDNMGINILKQGDKCFHLFLIFDVEVYYKIIL